MGFVAGLMSLARGRGKISIDRLRGEWGGYLGTC